MNTTELIESVKDRAAMPTSQNLFTNERIARMLSEELETAILPMMLRIQEDFYLTYQDFAPSIEIIPIPSDAIGQKIRSVGVYDDKGRLMSPLPRLDEVNQTVQFSAGFIMENYSIKIVQPGSFPFNVTLRVHYYRMPNKLTLESNAARVSGRDLALNTVSVATIPASFTAGAIIDASSSKNPYNLRERGIEIIQVSGSSVEVADASLIEVGDILTPTGTAFYPNAPTEIHKLLAQRVAVKTLESQGKASEMAGAMAVYKQMENDILYLLTPRSDGTAKKFTPGRGISRYVG
jgi:hypothetical protein